MSFPSNRAILTPKAQLCYCLSPRKATNSIQVKLFDNNLPVNLIRLKKNFSLKYEVNTKFPPEINNSITYKAIRQFQTHIDNFIKHLNYDYCCCSRFLNSAQLKQISNNNSIVIAAFGIDILHCYKFNCYGCFNGFFNFYYSC